MATKTELKKLEKIEKYSQELGGIRRKHLKSEKYLIENFDKLTFGRILKRKMVMSKRAKRMRKLVKKLRRFGVEIDLEQR